MALDPKILQSPTTKSELERFSTYRSSGGGVPWEKWIVADRAIRSGNTSESELGLLWDNRNDSIQQSIPHKKELLASFEAGQSEPIETQEEFDLRQKIEGAPRVDQRILDRIAKLRGQSYEQDPAVDAAMATADAIRGRQVQSVEGLAKILIGRETAADMRADIAGQDIAREMVRAPQADMLSRAGAAQRQQMDQAMQGALQERGQQQAAITAAESGVRRGDIAELRLAQQRDQSGLDYAARGQSLISDYLGIAAATQQRERQRALARSGQLTQEQVADLGMPLPTRYDYVTPAVVGGTSALSVGMEKYADIWGGTNKDPVSDYLRSRESDARKSGWSV